MDTTLISLLTFCLGLLLGHRLTLALHRRTEFNAAAEPVREYLLKSLDWPAGRFSPPSTLELDTFLQCLSRWRRSRFRKHWERHHQEYAAALRQDPTTGEVTYPDVSGITRELRVLLPMAARK